MHRYLIALLFLLIPSLIVAADERAATLEQRTLALVNAAREEHGLRPLAPAQKLADLARSHSRGMASRSVLSHEAPDGSSFADRVRTAGIAFRRIGENVAMNSGMPDPAAAAVEGWLKSPGHRKNMLDPAFTHTGMGVWISGDAVYFTQVFLTPP